MSSGNEPELTSIPPPQLVIHGVTVYTISQQCQASTIGHASYTLRKTRQAREYFYRALEAALEGEILGQVLHHPATVQIERDRAQELLSKLVSQLTPGVFSDAKARGRARNLEEGAAFGKQDFSVPLPDDRHRWAIAFPKAYPTGYQDNLVRERRPKVVRRNPARTRR